MPMALRNPAPPLPTSRDNDDGTNDDTADYTSGRLTNDVAVDSVGGGAERTFLFIDPVDVVLVLMGVLGAPRGVADGSRPATLRAAVLTVEATKQPKKLTFFLNVEWWKVLCGTR
ncbi:hypothetical protein H0H92_005945 [Tricholoma furcatifolium]|nr:hypothetical protein H0H92_005945 [Tricholoma furcatifolium]